MAGALTASPLTMDEDHTGGPGRRTHDDDHPAPTARAAGDQEIALTAGMIVLRSWSLSGAEPADFAAAAWPLALTT